MKRSPLKRYTRIKAKRSTPRTHKLVVRLTGAELQLLRYQCWARDGARCRNCEKRVYWDSRFPGDPTAFDMAHIRNKRMYGDTLDNVRTLCHACHMAEHNGKLRG